MTVWALPVLLLILLAGFALFRRQGQQIERGGAAEAQLDEMDKATKARNDAASADNPRRRLRDFWSQ